jgi:hypothetical protein
MNAVYFVVRCIAFAFIFVGKGVIFVAIRVGKVFKFWYYDLLLLLSKRHFYSKYWEQRILTCTAMVIIFPFNTFWIPFFLVWLLHSWWWMLIAIVTGIGLGALGASAIWGDESWLDREAVKRENVKWHAEIETAQLRKERQEKEKEAVIAKMYVEPDPMKMKRKINF